MELSIILLRTSTKQQQPELELADCLAYNISKGWNLAHDPFIKQESAYKNAHIWKEELAWAISNKVNHIIVWNMDRFSRQPEEVVLNQVKMLSLIHNIQLHAVHGDTWSEIVESIGRLKEMGFVGQAISEFLEKLLKGMEFQRAYRESQVKSERIRAAVRKEGTLTKSYKGNKWGRRQIIEKLTPKVLALRELSIRQIISSDDIYYFDKNNNKKKPSIGTVQKILIENPITKT